MKFGDSSGVFVPFAEEFAILMIKFLTNNSAGWLFLMSDDSTKLTEVTPETAVVKPEESAVRVLPDEIHRICFNHL